MEYVWKLSIGAIIPIEEFSKLYPIEIMRLLYNCLFQFLKRTFKTNGVDCK